MENKKLTPQIAAMYLGQKATITATKNNAYYKIGEQWVGEIYPIIIVHFDEGSISIKPHLRRLDSITEEDVQEIYKMLKGRTIGHNEALKYWWNDLDDVHTSISGLCVGEPKIWMYLLSKGFDLFGLIEAGEAIDINAK